MHSSLNRAQAVFGFFTTVALFVAGFAALSVFLYPADNAKTEVEVKNVQVYVYFHLTHVKVLEMFLLANGME